MRCTDRKASTFVLDCRELTGSKIRKMMAKLRITFRSVTLHGARGSTSGGQGRQASCLGAAAAFLPTKQWTTLMGRFEQGQRDLHAMASIQRWPKIRWGWEPWS